MLKSGWVNKPLGEVCTLQRGFDLPKHSRTDGEFPLISSSGEIDRIVDFKLNAPGVATGRSGSIGNVFFIEENYWPLNTVLYVKDFHGNDERFVYYLLKRFDLNKYATGAGVPTLNRNHVHDEIVAIPESKEEQTRIVAILDEAFANISQAVANAEKNLANARELFDSYLNEVFTRKGEGWKTIAFDQLADFKNGLNYTKSSSGDFIKIVGVKNFKNDFFIDDNDLDVVQIDDSLNDLYRLKENDILIVRSNGSKKLIGRALLVGYVNSNVSYSGFTIRARLKNNEIEPAYLVHYLKSQTVRDILVSSGNGANISSLNQSSLSCLPISYPPPKMQVKIIENIDLYHSEVTNLTVIYERKLAALAELKQALLQKAFTGELTA